MHLHIYDGYRSRKCVNKQRRGFLRIYELTRPAKRVRVCVRVRGNEFSYRSVS